MGTDTTYAGSLPGAGQYGEYADTVNKAYQTAQQQVTDSRNSYLTAQGFTGQYGADGTYTGATVNADSPTGGYQRMAQSNANQGEADQAAMAGIGFQGGLRKQFSEQAQNNYSDYATKFADDMRGALSPLDEANRQNTADQTDKLTSGLESDITAAITAGSFNPANYDGIVIGGHTITGDQVGQMAANLGWKPTSPGSGVTAPTGGGTAQAHPFYAAYRAAHPGNKMTLAQWVAAGSPGRPNGKWNGH